MKRGWMVLLQIPFLGVAILAYDNSEIAVWVGAADVDLEFNVTDADSAVAIGDATVTVETTADATEESFRLRCGPDGVAHKVIASQTTTGRQSRLSFTNTYGVNLPFWRFQVAAAGFQTSDWMELHSPTRGTEAKSVGPTQAHLVIPVLLRRGAIE